MTSASETLKDASFRNLLELGLQIEADLERNGVADSQRKQAFELGHAQFTQINALLKSTLDAADAATFLEVERVWAKMFEDLYFSDVPGEPDTEEAQLLPGEASIDVRKLVRYRRVLWLGLSMWASHLLSRPARAGSDEMPMEALRILRGRFETIETLLDVFERASEEGPEDRLPWTSWFLSELPTREAHFIPTRSELLFATVLFATVLASAESQALRPREWLIWQFDDITRSLDRLDSEAERWSAVMPAPPALDPPVAESRPLQWWHERVERARAMFTQGKSDTETDQREKVRTTPLDPERVNGFRVELLRKTRGARLIRDIFALQGGLVELAQPPADYEPLMARSWLPKSSFTRGSRVVGLDMSAGDLGRDTIRAEVTQLLGTLDVGDPRGPAENIRSAVAAAVDELKDREFRPSLIVMPSGWALQQALGLQRGRAEPHPLIPLVRAREFAGVIHGVPAMTLPQAPKDRIYVLDIGVAGEYREWPSEEQSGVVFDFKTFDREAAGAMLAEHPETRAEGVTDEDALQLLEERVLLTLTLCWEIRRGDPAGCVCVLVPADLQR